MDGGGWSLSTAEEAAEHGIEWPHPPLKLFVNFGTSSMTPAKRSTAIWPGTHLLTETAGKPINQDRIEPRRASHPPAQVIAPKGGALFRDLRMWVSDESMLHIVRQWLTTWRVRRSIAACPTTRLRRGI